MHVGLRVKVKRMKSDDVCSALPANEGRTDDATGRCCARP